MLPSDRIKSLAPVGAQFYRLLTKLSDGSSRLFPQDAGAFFRIGEAPTQSPIGRYTICYYDGSNQLISYLEDVLHLDDAQTGTGPSQQLHMSLLNASGAALPAGPGPAKPAKAPAPAIAPRAAAVGEDSAEPLSEDGREYRQHLQAMDLEDRQQEFLKNSSYVTELGEMFTLNRLMRREMLELHRIIVQHSQRAYQDIDQVKGTVHELLGLQKAVLEHAASSIARPPAPPPDYVGLGHSALAVLKDVSVALIQRTAPKDAAPALPGSSAPQLPAASNATKAAEVVPSAPPTAPDALTRMAEKLQALSTTDLALAVSSPERWKALLDELRAPEKPGSPTEAGTPTPAPTPEGGR